MNDHKNVKAKNIIIFITLFLIGVTGHFIIADFPKVMETYPDELRYYTIARSLFQNNGLQIRGIDTNFQKVMYSILIAPLFGIKDGTLRATANALLNSVVMVSAVFPIWLIGKELNTSYKCRFVVMFISIIWPDLMYTMTYMSEVLYWPLCAWCIYLWLIKEKNQKICQYVFYGLLCYLLYFTKEIGLAFLMAEVCYEIILFVHWFWTHDNKRTINRKRICGVSVSVCIFICCHIALKSTIFKGLGNSYNQMSIDAILSVHNFMYMLYAFIYYLIATLVSCLIIPILMPLINLKKMENLKQRLFVFMVAFLFIVSATVAYTISVREDLDRVIPRVHLRYIGPAIIIILLIFLSTKSVYEIRGSLKYVLTICICAVAIFKGVFVGSSVDQYALGWYVYATDIIRNIIDITNIEKPELICALIINVFVVFAVAGYLYLVWKNKGKIALNIFLFLLLITCLVSNLFAYKIVKNTMNGEKSTINEVVSISKYFDKIENETILYLTDGECINKKSKYMDTYMEGGDKVLFVSENILDEMVYDNPVYVKDKEFRESIWNNLYEDINEIDYIITEYDIEDKKTTISNLNKVLDVGGSDFFVYKNMNPQVLCITSNSKFGLKNEGLTVYFMGEKYNALDYIEEGISDKEEYFSWTDGDVLKVKIPVHNSLEKLHVKIHILDTFNGSKSYVVKQENDEIVRGALQGEGNIEFDAYTNNDELRFELNCVDAQVVSDVYPESTDNRKIAFQLQTMTICENDNYE